jgi:hypothetical protein
MSASPTRSQRFRPDTKPCLIALLHTARPVVSTTEFSGVGVEAAHCHHLLFHAAYVAPNACEFGGSTFGFLLVADASCAGSIANIGTAKTRLGPLVLGASVVGSP